MRKNAVQIMHFLTAGNEVRLRYIFSMLDCTVPRWLYIMILVFYLLLREIIRCSGGEGSFLLVFNAEDMQLMEPL